MSEHRWTVSSLVRYLKLKLDNDQMLQNITVIGELSNFNHHHSGHMYFTLKDDKSRMNCVMFKSYASSIDFKPENGLEVVLTADMSVFEASGSVQLYAKEMIPYGLGNLALKFEQLKKQLASEGLFSDDHKKTIPKYPNKIALVTGANTAAYQDLRTTLARRWPLAEVEVFNALVQGENAYKDVVAKLEMADNSHSDVVILARGGGSIEDLWTFNEEVVARFIYNMKTPIISGVGHETDFTIADFVSDLRAPTPTGAAELATPNIIEVHQEVLAYKQKLFRNIRHQRDLAQQKIDYYQNNAVFTHPELMIKDYIQRVQMYRYALSQWSHHQKILISQYNRSKDRYLNTMNDLLNKEQNRINISKERLLHNQDNLLQKQKNRFKQQLGLLDSYSPLNTLKRGYSITTKEDQTVVSVNNIEVRDELKITLSDGTLYTEVLKKEKNNE